ncbi:diaminopimelate decarboxylase [Murimonas intestini]|uniref:Diaminopimelate decarboxylase n=1 Tax=Murimonas intestini TaxID=1337051 RepID=A0AB73T2V9_9FIRM|nr:diaminopimelate decarboxylase [Murimonas intestini]MCR1841481.1 diaminopimelate decarboxylase [Murimonas intestini]MCR1866987.1 diaminopimelate decarboxylase [Murimonas intestini]MCR1884010.1 diaminopimelate decarboxylase [Murimonas intestini]
MQKIYTKVTDEMNFYEGNDPTALAKEYGTPLYVYNERILRTRCRELKNLVTYPNFVADFSAKANSNLAFLQIVRSEGLEVDAMSPGEIYIEKAAGFKSDEIFYICNNVSEEEMQYAVSEGVLVSVDSISQLEQYGRLAPNTRVAVRFNPGVGAGHHDKVVTAGKKTKFGVDPSCIPLVKEILKKYNLTLAGINQHIGSLFMTGEAFLSSIHSLFDIARQFPDLEFIDLGGGFGIPYHKETDEARLDLKSLGTELDKELYAFAEEYGRQVKFRIEPGRYISAECCVLLGQVHSVKENSGITYAGCDVGFNVLARPVMYDSYHGIEIYRSNDAAAQNGADKTHSTGDGHDNNLQPVTVVGNICESGDILAKDRMLPPVMEKDILGILDAGAYGFTMSSNYNNRLRPAEVLIRESGEAVLIRERDTLEDLKRHMISI